MPKNKEVLTEEEFNEKVIGITDVKKGVPSLNIYQKMLKIMEAIEYLNKDDHVKYGTTNYKAMSEENVTKKFRIELIKQHLVVFPFEQEVKVNEMHKLDANGNSTLVGFLTTTNTKYKLVDADTQQEIIIASSGSGVDSQDKGVGKAMTYSFKYLFLRSFATPTGDDPDKISSEELTDMQQKELDKVKKPAPISDKDLDKAMTDKFPGTVVENFDKNKITKGTLENDPDVLALKKRIEEAGKTSIKIVEALIRSYTSENKDTLLRILESKV